MAATWMSAPIALPIRGRTTFFEKSGTGDYEIGGDQQGEKNSKRGEQFFPSGGFARERSHRAFQFDLCHDSRKRNERGAPPLEFRLARLQTSSKQFSGHMISRDARDGIR
jgi:hypothetical protein